jgi:AcrR family transcriptional regulator
MRTWSVANATAAKVLAELRDEGLVRVVPSVGTVVAEATRPRVRPDRRRPDRKRLDRDTIVDAAIAIADAEGLAAVSLRRVAVELGVATAAVRRHVGDDLVPYMIDRAIGEEPFPAPGPAGWRARLELATRMQWRAARRHRWLLPSMTLMRPQAVPAALAYTRWVFDSLAGLGLTPGDVLHIHVMLFSFARGLATSLDEELEAEQDSGITSDDWMKANIHRFPEVPFSGPLDDFGPDSIFEFGLQRLLDGVAAYLPAR